MAGRGGRLSGVDQANIPEPPLDRQVGGRGCDGFDGMRTETVMLKTPDHQGDDLGGSAMMSRIAFIAFW